MYELLPLTYRIYHNSYDSSIRYFTKKSNSFDPKEIKKAKKKNQKKKRRKKKLWKTKNQLKIKKK